MHANSPVDQPETVSENINSTSVIIWIHFQSNHIKQPDTDYTAKHSRY
jgi:hypothetical protein